MTITLISEQDYELLLNIQKERPILTFKNVGYEYLDKDRFDEDDKIAFDQVTSILKNCVKGFQEFNNFTPDSKGELRVRFQYDWSADGSNSLPFTGVGYLYLDELHKGFREKISK